MAVTQSLTLTETLVWKSDNTSDVRIVWKSTQSGESWNGYERQAKYYVSINGGSETAYSVYYTLTQNRTVTIKDITITVPHRIDGTGTVKVRTWMDTGIDAGVVEQSKTLTLTPIARSSGITSAYGIFLGTACTVEWTPLHRTYSYKLKFSLGEWNYTTEAIRPNTISPYSYDYTMPLDVAEQLPNARKGTMTVTLYTYSDATATTQVGSPSSKTFTVTVPDISSTKPNLTMTVSPDSALPSAFDGLYIQGKSRAKVTFSGSGKYGADISSYGLTVLGKDYASPFQTEYLSTEGTVAVNGRVKDTREFVTEKVVNISVIPYSKPKLIHGYKSNGILCARCDASGKLMASGTYLKIKVGRSYSKVVSDDTQKNFCQLQYRYKTTSASAYSDYVTLLAKDASTDYVDVTLGNVVTSISTSYMVELSAVDDIGDSTVVTFVVPTDDVAFHLKDGGDGAAFGKYAEKSKALDIASDWDLYYKGDKIDKSLYKDTGWVELSMSSDASTPSIETRGGAGCFYRVINENHVFVRFNCAFEYNGESIILNGVPLPEEYRPENVAMALFPVNDRAIARASVASDGYIYVNYAQNIATASTTTEYSVTWIDGYIDYWL